MGIEYDLTCSCGYSEEGLNSAGGISSEFTLCVCISCRRVVSVLVRGADTFGGPKHDVEPRCRHCSGTDLTPWREGWFRRSCPRCGRRPRLKSTAMWD